MGFRSGTTYAQYPTHFEILPGLKLEFYEVDRPLIWLWGTTPSTTESLLGTAYSQTDGSYEFEFSFSYHFLSLWFLQDRVPDIRVKIYQFEDGNWQQPMKMASQVAGQILLTLCITDNGIVLSTAITINCWVLIL